MTIYELFIGVIKLGKSNDPNLIIQKNKKIMSIDVTSDDNVIFNLSDNSTVKMKVKKLEQIIKEQNEGN
ncbi:Uncharacterised protein [Acholeplasma oculi]|uniref:Uncharacterized protein n=1 Tax=Acholeplasma oculi TaxID=35623 RepID=A0A061ACB2_9MOLU|nr:hypothetical protein [Acholeplasma oculi]CDR31049.1 hypothetical protein Aocu_09760 [Acholeplasma oculi]SUT90617.1 Uncharacterised protein [Acholeplasma oculi]